MSENKRHKKGKITLYVVLRALVIAVMIGQIFRGNYNNVFLCVLTLILFMIPVIVDRKLNIKLPTALETIILLFIYSAEILGEIQNFYSVFAHWDTMLHTLNGFLMAAIGFAMIDILNQSPKIHINMSPVFVAFVAFCFSMTIGVLWEFFEFGMDTFFATDMQKDSMVQQISSVFLNPTGQNIPVVIPKIQSTVLNSADGQIQTITGGYLDIGLADTMKDLIVNFIGAAVFSVIGLFYIKNRGKGGFAQSFIPQLKTKEEIEESRREWEDTAKPGKRRKKTDKKY